MTNNEIYEAFLWACIADPERLAEWLKAAAVLLTRAELKNGI